MLLASKEAKTLISACLFFSSKCRYHYNQHRTAMGNVHTHTHSLPGAHAHTHTPIYMSPILIQILRQTDTLRNKIHHFYHLQCIYSGSQRRSFILMKSIPASDLSDVTQFPSLSQSQLLTSSGPLLLFCCVCF